MYLRVYIEVPRRYQNYSKPLDPACGNICGCQEAPEATRLCVGSSPVHLAVATGCGLLPKKVQSTHMVQSMVSVVVTSLMVWVSNTYIGT